jgi:hypothetical protein
MSTFNRLKNIFCVRGTLTYKAWLIKVYSLLILTPVASYATCMYVNSISRHDETSHVVVLNID